VEIVINVLSLFDGISCGQMALKKAELEIDSYYASEIENSAITITQHNFPDSIQIGDVRNINLGVLPKIDLLIGGSPCQGFSVNGRKLNFEDERSKLLFEYIKIRDIIKPKYWLLENVATMKQDIKEMIDEYIGVKGVSVNSNIFSAQNRKRYYWTNIPFEIPKQEAKLIIKDILEENVDEKYLWDQEKIAKQYINPSWTDGVLTLNPKMFSGRQTYQQDRIYDYIGKMVALTATLGNRFNIKDKEGYIRKLTIREQARLQTIPEYIDFRCVSELQASKGIGNGWTVDVIAHILGHLKK